MLPQRFYPMRNPLREFRGEVGRLFGSLGGGFESGLRFRGRSFPALNVWEDDECFYTEAELPGLTMEDLDVQVITNELTIKGAFSTVEGEDITYHHQERATGSFMRSVAFHSEVDAEKVGAVLKDGLLKITLPKAAGAKARKISVQTE